ncbi:MAG: VWA domain-containing protein [Bryobacteraceae bacterium]|nr:VWA domain-containing protein [Bryobacteraceae bacterium]
MLVAAGLLAAQTPMMAQNSLQVTVVNPAVVVCPNASLTVRVRSLPNGQTVGGLTKSNFSVTESGEARDFTLTPLTSAPDTSVVLLLDISGSIGNRIGDVRRAAQDLVNRLPGSVPIHVVAFNDGRINFADFTTDHASIVARLNGLTQASGGTALYDSVVYAATRLSRLPGRRVIVVMSDGQDTASSETLSSAIASAVSADASIFTMGHGDEYNNPQFRQILSQLAYDTGGFLYGSVNSTDLSYWASLIAPQISTFYEIAYQPRTNAFPQTAVKIVATSGPLQGEVTIPAASCSSAVTFTASPNPIEVSNPGDLGSSLLRWELRSPFTSGNRVVLRSFTYDGPILGEASRPVTGQTTVTGIPDGAVIYLQLINPTTGQSNTRQSTLGAIRFRVQAPAPAQPTVTLTPVTDCANRQTVLEWTNPGNVEAQIRVNGTPVTAYSQSGGTLTVRESWLADGMVFTLTARSGQELARATLRVTCAAPQPGPGPGTGTSSLTVTIVADCDNRSTVVTWNHSSAVQIRVNGTPLTAYGANSGTLTVRASWLANGQIFTLHETSGREVARASLVVLCGGAPPPAVTGFTATPVASCFDRETQLQWPSFGVPVRVLVNGSPLTGFYSGAQSIPIRANWLADGMILTLNDAFGRQMERTILSVPCSPKNGVSPLFVRVAPLGACSEPHRLRLDYSTGAAALRLDLRVNGVILTSVVGEGSFTVSEPWLRSNMEFSMFNGVQTARAYYNYTCQ